MSFLNKNNEVLFAIDKQKQNINEKDLVVVNGELNIGYRFNLHIKIANSFSKSFLGETNTDAETPYYLEENKDKQHSLPFDPDPKLNGSKILLEGNDKIIESLLPMKKKMNFPINNFSISFGDKLKRKYFK